jgi:hypothetical protein
MSRYPELHLRLHSRNPMAWVSAIRSALRKTEADADEIHQFTVEALAAEGPGEISKVCSRWAHVEVV